MDDRGDAISIGEADAFECALDTAFGGQIDANAFRGRRRRAGRHLIEADQSEATGEFIDQGASDEPAAAGNDDEVLRFHCSDPPSSSLLRRRLIGLLECLDCRPAREKHRNLLYIIPAWR